MKERGIKIEFETAAGRKVRVFKGTAYDMCKAQMMCKAPEEAQLALASLLVEIDGQMLPMEEWKEMDLAEYMEIVPFLFGSPETPQAS